MNTSALPDCGYTGDDGAGVLAELAEHVDDRVGELALALVRLDLAEERGLGPHRQLTLTPRLVEEDDVEQRRAVVDRCIDDHPTLAAPPARDAPDLGEHRRLLADRKLRDLGFDGAVVIAARVVLEHVEHALDAHQRESVGQLRGDAELRHRHRPELAQRQRARRYSTPMRYG